MCKLSLLEVHLQGKPLQYGMKYVDYCKVRSNPFNRAILKKMTLI